MRTTVLSLLVFLPLSAFAQAPDRASEVERGGAWLDRLNGAGVDEGLLGTTHYGIHVALSTNVGQARFTLDRASRESGAVYKLTTAVDLRVGDLTVEVRESALLDARLALVRHEQTRAQLRDGAADQTPQKAKVTQVLKKKRWTWTQTVPSLQHVRRHDVDAQGPHHGRLSCWLQLARTINRRAKGSYVVRRIAWTVDEPGYRDVRFTVSEIATRVHRGQKLRTATVRMRSEGESDASAQIGPKGELLAFWAEDSFRFVAGTEDEVRRDLPGPKQD